MVAVNSNAQIDIVNESPESSEALQVRYVEQIPSLGSTGVGKLVSTKKWSAVSIRVASNRSSHHARPPCVGPENPLVRARTSVATSKRDDTRQGHHHGTDHRRGAMLTGNCTADSAHQSRDKMAMNDFIYGEPSAAT